MTNKDDSSKTTEIGFLGFLTLIFITLKLTGYISWSWWWVLSPLWMIPVVILGVFALVFAYLVIKDMWKGKK